MQKRRWMRRRHLSHAQSLAWDFASEGRSLMGKQSAVGGALKGWLIVGIVMGVQAVGLFACCIFLSYIALGMGPLVYSLVSLVLSVAFVIGCAHALSAHELGVWLTIISATIEAVATLAYYMLCDGWLFATLLAVGVICIWLFVVFLLLRRSWPLASLDAQAGMVVSTPVASAQKPNATRANGRVFSVLAACVGAVIVALVLLVMSPAVFPGLAKPLSDEDLLAGMSQVYGKDFSILSQESVDNGINDQRAGLAYYVWHLEDSDGVDFDVCYRQVDVFSAGYLTTDYRYAYFMSKNDGLLALKSTYPDLTISPLVEMTDSSAEEPDPPTGVPYTSDGRIGITLDSYADIDQAAAFQLEAFHTIMDGAPVQTTYSIGDYDLDDYGGSYSIRTYREGMTDYLMESYVPSYGSTDVVVKSPKGMDASCDVSELTTATFADPLRKLYVSAERNGEFDEELPAEAQAIPEACLTYTKVDGQLVSTYGGDESGAFDWSLDDDGVYVTGKGALFEIVASDSLHDVDSPWRPVGWARLVTDRGGTIEVIDSKHLKWTIGPDTWTATYGVGETSVDSGEVVVKKNGATLPFDNKDKITYTVEEFEQLFDVDVSIDQTTSTVNITTAGIGENDDT